MWVDQWPLSKEKIDAAQQLVQEQLELGHIEQSNSPWNSPIFVIKKKSGKWRLLQDLRKVNETMEVMGALQPGLPSPMAIPRNAHIIILDLKDCFYTIPLAPQDCPRFAFSVPSVNFSQPMRRYH